MGAPLVALAMQHGVAALPGFEESLRLLLDSERYSLTDIAMMFGVSRERIRQLAERYGLSTESGRGLYSVRIWDDRENRFRPISRAEFSGQALREQRAQMQRQRAQRTRQQQAAIIAQVTRLRVDLRREPSWREIWVAIGGNPDAPKTSCCPLVLGRWDSRRISSAERLRDFREMTGAKARPVGGRGHLGPRRRKRKEFCETHSEAIHTYPNGARRCLSCDREYRRRRGRPNGAPSSAGNVTPDATARSAPSPNADAASLPQSRPTDHLSEEI